MQNVYTPKYLTATAATAIASGNVFLHTIVAPIALTGSATIEQTDGTDYFVLPIGTIGTLTFDCALPGGLSFSQTAQDKIIINYGQ